MSSSSGEEEEEEKMDILFDDISLGSSPRAPSSEARPPVNRLAGAAKKVRSMMQRGSEGDCSNASHGKKARAQRSGLARSGAGGRGVMARRDFYFSFLDMPWRSLWFYFVAIYFSAAVAFGGLNFLVLVDGGLRSPDVRLTSRFSRAFCFAVENVVTMGWGVMAPESAAAFAMGTMEQLVGIGINVLLFTIVCTKFQHPSPAMQFSEKCIVCKRDGVLHLLVRMANERRNLIYHPTARLAFLRPERTQEGETFVRSRNLELASQPSVITGAYTFAHKIDASSPLYDILKPGFSGEQEIKARRTFLDERFAITCTFVGRDGVYHDDVHCIHRFRCDRDVLFDHKFSWMNARDANGNLTLDYSKLDATEPLIVKRKQSRMAAVRLASDAPPDGLFEEDGLHLCVGALRLHDDNPDQPLCRNCPFCKGVESWLREAGVECRTYKIDVSHKPKWFVDFCTEHDQPAATPAVYYRKDGVVTTLFDSADILAALPDFFPRSPAIDRLSGVGAQRWRSDAKIVTEIIGMWFTNCVKTTPATLAEERDPDLQLLRRQKVDKVFDWWVAHLEDRLEQNGFLSGLSEPDVEDCRWGNLCQAFFADDIYFDPSLALNHKRLPKTHDWLKRLHERPAFQETLDGLGDADIDIVHARTFQTILIKHVPNLLPIFPIAFKIKIEKLKPEDDDDDRYDDDREPGSPANKYDFTADDLTGAESWQFCL